jgi:hypothetical protein
MSVIRSSAYPQNAPIAELRTAEMYVVCSARLWVAHYRGIEGAALDLERGFTAAGVADEGLAALCRFFDTVAAAAARGLDIRCVRCAHLGDDEAVLLQAVSHLQQGCEARAMRLLEDWMPAAALRVAMAPLAAFAAALAEAGLVVLRRHGEAGQMMATSVMGCTDRGVALVH